MSLRALVSGQMAFDPIRAHGGPRAPRRQGVPQKVCEALLEGPILLRAF